MARIYTKPGVSLRGMYSSKTQVMSRVKSRSMTPEQRAAMAREQARKQIAKTHRITIHGPGSRPSTKTGMSSFVGSREIEQLKRNSSARMKGTSVQNRRQTPKTYI